MENVNSELFIKLKGAIDSYINAHPVGAQVRAIREIKAMLAVVNIDLDDWMFDIKASRWNKTKMN